MMVFGVRVSGIIIAAFIIFASYCHAAVFSSTDLIEKAKQLDGKKVEYQGELVTAILNRGEHSWINLNDGVNAIGIWCKSSQLNKVRFTGDYKNKGDVIEVFGEFHRACPVHGGELDIHADNIKLVKAGYLIKETLDFKRIKSSVILLSLTILALIIFRKRL